jgi:hypothetical protein
VVARDEHPERLGVAGEHAAHHGGVGGIGGAAGRRGAVVGPRRRLVGEGRVGRVMA